MKKYEYTLFSLSFSYDFKREPVTVGCVCSRSSDDGSRSSNDTAN